MAHDLGGSRVALANRRARLTQFGGIRTVAPLDVRRDLCGAIAQLGERNTGSVEVDGSIPSSSTTLQSDSICLRRQTELVAVGGMVFPLRIG